MSEAEFGRYRLIELLGRGGMGEVWRAFDNDTQRIVAVKLLSAPLADDPQFAQRFRREAFAAAGLANPHVVPIHHFGEINGRLYVDMRLIEGHDLHQILTEGPLPLSRAVSIIAQIASALQSAHKIGLVHRDVKPSNILVAEDDFAYLIDFGIARGLGQTSLTGTGGAIGTWAYMAPERFSRDQNDARSDVYALACVLHECLTGSQPFPSDSLERQLAAHLTVPPPRPSLLQPTVPSAMDAVVAKGMAKDPDQRFATVKEFGDAARAATSESAGAPHGPHHDAPSRRTPPETPAPPLPPEHTTHVLPHGFVPPPAPTGQHGFAGAAPYVPAASPPPRESRRGGSRARLAFAGVGALLVVIAVVAGMVVLGDHDKPGRRAAPSSPPTAARNTGPFTGTFKVAMGKKLLTTGKVANTSDAAELSETWRLRSACGAKGCVATASTGGRYPAREVVFDDVGGRWLAVTTNRSTCKGIDADSWEVILLQPRPDGTMAGEWTSISENECFSKRTLVFTRTGDADLSALGDPGRLPARVVSAGEGFRGRYDELIRYADGNKFTYRGGVRTDCLRAGDRCMSAFVDEDAKLEAFVFGNRSWTRNAKFDNSCPSGGTSHTHITATLPLPPTPQNPATLLAGHGYKESTGTKCASTALDYTFTRTGD